MYFIQDGIVDVVTECGAKIARLKDGAYFGGLKVYVTSILNSLFKKIFYATISVGNFIVC